MSPLPLREGARGRGNITFAVFFYVPWPMPGLYMDLECHHSDSPDREGRTVDISTRRDKSGLTSAVRKTKPAGDRMRPGGSDGSLASGLYSGNAYTFLTLTACSPFSL